MQRVYTEEPQGGSKVGASSKGAVRQPWHCKWLLPSFTRIRGHMARPPENITRSQMLRAIEDIDRGVYLVPPERRSTVYCLVYEGDRYKHYSPKEVVRFANVMANGEEWWRSKGGDETNDFCRSRGFEVVRHGSGPH